MTPDVAVVFVPSALALAAASRCLDHCKERGYRVAGVITSDWRAVLAMLGTGGANVVVGARPHHATAPGAPRIEVAAEDGRSGRRPASADVVPWAAMRAAGPVDTATVRAVTPRRRRPRAAP